MNKTVKSSTGSKLLLLKRYITSIKVKNFCLYIDGRYKDVQPIGSGSYGIVCKAIDSVTRMTVAIKVTPLTCKTDESCLRCLRELKYLRFFHDCREVVDLVDYYLYPYTTRKILPSDPFTIYMITPLYEYDLELVIDAKNYLSFDQIRLICYQLFLGLRYIHSAGFLHRDIKPANILLSSSADVALCDFGLARGDLTNLTTYVVTRLYRAPELLVENKNYTNKIDIWSAGIVLAEMFHGSCVLNASDNRELLDLILDWIGKPSEEDLLMVEKPEVRAYIQNKEITTGKSLQERLSRSIPEDGLDLLTRLLQFNPTKRLSALEALQHPFFGDLNYQLKPISCPNQYELQWEENLIRHYDNEHIWEEYVREQQYYPLTKCKYMC